MSRPRRLESPGGLWHVTNRGVEKRPIFLDTRDANTFLRLLADAVTRFRWRLHAYVLMSNHYHLLIETIAPTLSRGMQRLGGGYADFFNWRHERVGPLFQGRFNAEPLDTAAYLLEAARYIVLNPVRARLARGPAEWRWSSYNATADLTPPPPWLFTATIHAHFGTPQHYRAFAASGIGIREAPWRGVAGQIIVGGVLERVQHERPIAADAIQSALCKITESPADRAAPLFIRLAYAWLARSEALTSLRDIGTALGVGASGAAYLVQRAKHLRNTDDGFRDLVERVRAAIRR